MKFLVKITPNVKIILWAIFIVSLVVAVIAVAVLFGAKIEMSKIDAISVVSVCVIIMLLTTVLNTLHYKFDKDCLRLYFAFLDTFSGKVTYDKILNLVVDGDKMYISYLNKGTDPIIALIAISPKHFDRFKTELLSKNPNIVYYKVEDEITDCQQ